MFKICRQGTSKLIANRFSGTLTTSQVPVALPIGDSSGGTQMKAKFDWVWA
jgi:hypothetical protein